MINTIISNLLLVIWSISDIRKKSISRLGLILGAFASTIIVTAELLLGVQTAAKPISGLVAGGIVWLLAVFSKERIGKGDAFVIAIVGILLGGIRVLMGMMYGLIIATVVCLPRIVSKKLGRKQTIAFVPYLFAGNILCSFMEGGLFGYIL